MQSSTASSRHSREQMDMESVALKGKSLALKNIDRYRKSSPLKQVLGIKRINRYGKWQVLRTQEYQ